LSSIPEIGSKKCSDNGVNIRSKGGGVTIIIMMMMMMMMMNTLFILQTIDQLNLNINTAGINPDKLFQIRNITQTAVINILKTCKLVSAIKSIKN